MKEQRENSGVLFKNDRKQTDKQPDYVGALNVGGAEYELAAWIKQGEQKKFLSIVVKPKPEAVPERKPANARSDMDDEIAW
jgi:hypothetical protein